MFKKSMLRFAVLAFTAVMMSSCATMEGGMCNDMPCCQKMMKDGKAPCCKKMCKEAEKKKMEGRMCDEKARK